MPIDIKKDTPQIALKKLKAREEILKQLEAIAGLGSWEIDLTTKQAIWSDESYKIYGIEKGTPVSVNTFYSVLLPEYLIEAKQLLAQALQTNKLFKFTCKVRRQDGAIRDLLIHGKVIHDANKQPLKLIGTTQDITEFVSLKEELKHQAYHDILTGLPNRTLFQDRIKQAIAHAKRNNEKFALLFLDLDQFKKINDSLGHHIGDQVLIEASKRFKKILREEDSLARLGGDEFTIILPNIKNEKSAATVAQKLLNSMNRPIEIPGHSLHISSSIGISIYPVDAQEKDDLIKYADTAMYKAKEDGRNNFQFYSADMTQNTLKKVMLENSLRAAIEEEQFCVYFQPQYRAEDEKIIGMEALVRWIHPHLGMVPPSEFIPFAEESGLIVAIDKIVMRKAIQTFGKWYKSGLNPGKLSLNLSMKQLAQNNFIIELLALIQEYDFNANWLELEVTEGEMMQNPEQSIKKLQRLSKIGIQIAIDDFGTGYSSLSYLKKLPLHKLKIDQSFVRGIPNDSDDVSITRAIIAIAKSLNLKLIAEGVETKEQKEFMLQEGCPFIQGYYYSKPLNATDMERLLHTQLNEI